MNTELYKIDEHNIDAAAKEILKKAGDIIKEGGLVAFPTETVYGLGGDALNPESSKKIYAAKGRPSDNPLIVHVSNMDDVAKIVKEVPEAAKKLAPKIAETIGPFFIFYSPILIISSNFFKCFQ